MEFTNSLPTIRPYRVNISSVWTAASGQAGGVPLLGEFCPAINSVKLARQFGVLIVLEPAGSHGPSGSILDGIFDNGDLYKIPGAGAANLVGLNAPADSTGKVVKVDHPSPSSWRVVTSGSTPQLLRLHLTRLPGWHATIDGRPLTLKPFSGVMMEAQVPRGRHVVELTYWRRTFTVGIVLAIVGVLCLAMAAVVSTLRQRRSGTCGRVRSASQGLGPTTHSDLVTAILLGGLYSIHSAVWVHGFERGTGLPTACIRSLEQTGISRTYCHVIPDWQMQSVNNEESAVYIGSSR